jgi:glycosyltransferase involved in cell wall biosynthesis
MQTYNDFEVVISDDASTDNTVDEIENYFKNNVITNKVNKLYNIENLGVVGNFNRAIKYLNNELIVLQSGDDVSDLKRISQVVNVFNDYNVDMVVSDAFIINEEGELIKHSFYNKPNFNKIILHNKKNVYDITSKIYGGFSLAFKRNLLDCVNGKLPDIARNEDEFLNFLAILNNGLAYLNKSLVYYRKHNNNLSFWTKERSLDLIKKIYINTLNNIKQKFRHIKNNRKNLSNSFYLKIYLMLVFKKVIAKQKFIIRIFKLYLKNFIIKNYRGVNNG